MIPMPEMLSIASGFGSGEERSVRDGRLVWNGIRERARVMWKGASTGYFSIVPPTIYLAPWRLTRFLFGR